MRKIRVLVAEDHTIVRKGLCALLAAEASIEIVGEAEDGREAIRLAEDCLPDVVLMDLAMPGLNGLEATYQLKERLPQTRVLILTVHANEEYILQVLRSGARGYVVKKAAPAELVSAILAVSRGEFFLSPSISRTVVEDYLRRAELTATGDEYERLSPREREVLQLMAEGRPNREIAEVLCISVKTVESHRARLLEKLGLHSTADLILYAVRKGIILLNP